MNRWILSVGANQASRLAVVPMPRATEDEKEAAKQRQLENEKHVIIFMERMYESSTNDRLKLSKDDVLHKWRAYTSALSHDVSLGIHMESIQNQRVIFNLFVKKLFAADGDSRIVKDSWYAGSPKSQNGTSVVQP